MNTTIAVQKAPLKLDYVNALRGLAILGVVFVHIMEFGTAKVHFTSLLISAFYQGARGVQLFFVASAFTLWLSMSRRKQEKHPTRNFFLRRFFRIAPMYYVGVLFYSLWFVYVQPRPSITPAAIITNLTFLHGINPYWINSIVPGGWSITVEMWFYCLAPLLFTKLKTVDQGARFIAYGILANCLLSFLLGPLHLIPEARVWSDFLFYYFPSQLPVFGFGILLYLLLAPSEEPKALQPTTWLLMAGVLLVSISAGLPYAGGSLTMPAQHYWFAGAFLLLALGLSQQAPRLLVNPVINYMGQISFSLYLVHFAVLYTLQVTGHDDFLHPTRMITALADYGIRFLFVLGVSCLLATFFYRFIEVPSQNLGKRLINRLEQP